jgi:hypothetical protein
MADFLFEKSINLVSRLHRGSQLFYILQPLSTDQRTDCHDSTRECPTCFPSSSHASSKSTSCLKDLSTSYIELFLQSCKNRLRSPKVVHVVLKRQFEDIFKQFFPILHEFSPLKKIPPSLFIILTPFMMEIKSKD